MPGCRDRGIRREPDVGDRAVRGVARELDHFWLVSIVSQTIGLS